MIRKKKTVQYMGVINLTPDSFSDGGIYNNATSFRERIFQLAKWADIIDLGAESTAPFNQAVGADMELARFEETFYPIIEKTADPALQISIDTYRPEVFIEVAKRVQKYWPNCPLIWNDVSGVVDDALLQALHGPQHFSYVFSHNLCGDRDKTSDHMQFVDEFVDEQMDLISHMERFFSKALKEMKCKRNILLDPCFGFSKTREQNHILLREFSRLANIFSHHHWVYGISRKSFLRFPKELDSKDPYNQSQLDQVQSYFIADTLQKVDPSKMIFRVHDQRTKNAVDSIQAILNN